MSKKIIIQSDTTSNNPLLKWGSDVHKMRARAFNDYEKDAIRAKAQWPEFWEEFNASKSR